MCCFTRNNLLPWSLSYRSRTFPSTFVHSFSLPVPLLGFSGEKPRIEQYACPCIVPSLLLQRCL